MKLVTNRPFPAEIRSRLLASAPDLQIVTVSMDDLDGFLRELGDADIVAGSFGGGSGSIFQRVVNAATKARWIHTSSAGVDEILCPEYYERDFVLTCGKGASVANLLAEHAMALLLALTRDLVRAARKRSWDRPAFHSGPTEIRDLTMGIVGLGAVGRELAKRAMAFEMRVIGIAAHASEPPPGVDALWTPEELPKLLSRSDVVVLILPNTPLTTNSFGAEQLRQMKPTALLINIGRGQVMESSSLEQALVEGWIAGAGLDVMPEEPWPEQSPLWQLDNVLLTPHIAGNSPQRSGRDMDGFCENLARFVRGEPLKSTVDRGEGY